MNRSLFRVLQACFVIVALTSYSNSMMAKGASGPPTTTDVGYRIQWVFGPSEATFIAPQDIAITTDVDGHATRALVVGYYNRSDRESPSAFVYDMQNPSDPSDSTSNQFWDIEDLVGSTPAGIPWTNVDNPLSSFQSVFRNVNSSGLMAGYVVDDSGVRIGVYLDLNQATLSLNLLPQPPNPFERYEGNDVTEAGDILVKYQVSHPDLGAVDEGYVFDPDTNHSNVIFDPITNLPIQFGRNSIQLSSFGQVVGEREDGVVIRHNLWTGQTVEIPDVANAMDLNDFGQFPSLMSLHVKPNGKGRTASYAVRIGADNSLEWRSALSSPYTSRINNQGDVVYAAYTNDTLYFNEALQLEFHLNDLVIPESDPDSWFTGDSQMRMSDCDATGFGWLATADQNALALLIPEIPGQSPGISVVPASGLITTEAGGTDSFDVVLDSQPAADVTIGISSSNTAEGTVDVASLTFTPADWDTAQTVTITGQDDAFEDGDVAYSIVTATATSSDPDYDGLDADDVSVTNEDDDSPPGGGSDTYSSDASNSNLDIPDNDAGGIASNILVGDHTISSLTVNLDISHQRPSDLDVYLVGPDDTQVKLFNFSGDNNVPDFNGTNSLGLWTIEVIDTRKKKTGSLNGWSITVDF